MATSLGTNAVVVGGFTVEVDRKQTPMANGFIRELNIVLEININEYIYVHVFSLHLLIKMNVYIRIT